MSKKKTIMNNQEFFEECVKNSDSISNALKALGYNTPSNFYTMFYRYVNKYNLDISHLKGRSELMKGNSIRRKYTDEEVFVENFTGGINNGEVKKRLYKLGIKVPICELCGQDENWITGKISLILDHINGNNKDNRILNLRIVCPNCDSTLPTSKGRNIKKTVL